MSSIVFSTATRMLMPALLLYSIYLLEAGHDEPGGGFVGGLVAASAFSLHALAFGVASARAMLKVHPRTLVGVGLLVALASGTLGLVSGQAFLTGRWVDVTIADNGFATLGTPLLFDVGVYLAVVGAAILIVFSLAET